MSKVRRALVSVSDKRGVAEFARGLVSLGVEILSTGGTAKVLTDAGVAVTRVSDYTGAPEILGGRVKTLHPRIHAGILARATTEHAEELAGQDIGLIDLVVVNLYPFEKTIANGATTVAEAVEQIDIGGPCMVRAAAKNHERVAVVIDPDDYGEIAEDLAANGEIGESKRRELAIKAFAHTAAYDTAIVGYLSAVPADADPAAAVSAVRHAPVRGEIWHRQRELRYGENPHQRAALYSYGAPRGVASAEVLQGKPLSYNNYLDIDAAYLCAREFVGPTAVVIKHSNPCGVASSQDGIARAYALARQTDPTSSFGGIVAVNRTVDQALASDLVETFLECVIAPDYDEDALSTLSAKRNLRLLRLSHWDEEDTTEQLRTVSGGVLVQDVDRVIKAAAEGEVVTQRKPSTDELASLDFVWRVAKHVKSNAIVFGSGTRTLAIGAGQMSRIDSVKLCQLKAEFPLDGACVASDAFFPFRDGLDAIADAGGRCVIQPGGSIRDQEVIDAANERGVSMVLSGMRHFRH